MKGKVRHNVQLLLVIGIAFFFSFQYSVPLRNNSSEDKLPYFLRTTDDWVQKTMDSLTLKEKIAQSLMIATWPNKGKQHQHEIDSLITNYNIGGLIVFQGNRAQTKEQIVHFQEKSKTPLLIGMDAEWGSAMRMNDAKRFPFQLTMGAADLPEQTEVIAQQMAYEIGALGVHINFSPVADVNSNPNNPVINFRSFGASALRVGNHVTSMVKGMERNGLMTCLKHFPGHGDTDKDSHFELPLVSKSLQELNVVDWTPFKMGRLAGASAVMMAHLQVPALDSSNTPSSLSSVVIQDYLRGKLKFSGLVISDALNMKAVSDRYGKVEVSVLAYKAGNDILLYPETVKEVIDAIYQQVQQGVISEEMVDEKCYRILSAKAHALKFKNKQQKVDEHTLNYAHYAIYEKALTVVKNDDNVIPLSSEKGDVALISLGESDGVFAERLNEYVSFDAYSGSTITTIKSALMKSGKKYSSVILNVHSSSILPRNNFSYPMGWENLIDFCANYGKVIVTLFGNPYVVNNKETFANASAAIFAFEQSKQGEDRAAQLIAGGFKGVSRLPITLCEGLEEGVGVETPDASRLKFTFPEELGISREKLKEIDVIAQHGIDVQAYPGCQIVAAKDGKVFYRKSFGKLTYEGIDSVDNHTVYDIASITKIASSTVALMKLQDEGKFSLDDQLKDYLPTLTGATPFGKLILRDILSHQAGLTPWIPFYTKTLTNGRPNSQLYTSTFSDAFSLKVANDLFLKTSYEEEMYKQILGTPIKPGNRYKYSDVGYYFTKKIIEQETGKSLDAFVENSFYIPMGLRTMRYNPLKHYSVHSIAPTEQDTYFRHELVRGYVHDMGAAMTNGVGGHAGVFTRATDLTALMQMLLNDGVYGGKRYLSKAVIKEYTSCQFCPRNRRGAGFDKPVTTLDGGPTCDLVSLKSFGHSGFTGTLTWADPEYGINYTFLSNRVYPSAENWKIVRMGIRTDIQKIIYEAVLESNQENQ